MEPRVNRPWELQGKVQETIGPLKKWGRDTFFKENLGSSVERSHRNVTQDQELLGYSSCGQLLTGGGVNTPPVVEAI